MAVRRILDGGWWWVRPVARVVVPIALVLLSFELMGSLYLQWVATLGPAGQSPADKSWHDVTSIGVWACWILAPVSIYVLRPRAMKAGCCPHCGYDRTGLPGVQCAVCPECGAPPS